MDQTYCSMETSCGWRGVPDDPNIITRCPECGAVLYHLHVEGDSNDRTNHRGLPRVGGRSVDGLRSDT